MFKFLPASAFLFCLLTSLEVSAQQTLVLQPDASTGKDAPVYSCVPCGFNNLNYGYQPSFNAIAWTNNGNVSTSRSLIQFDLSSIPANATILSAQLSLFANPASSHSTLNGPNQTVLQRITSNWQESSVTWDTQPATTNLHEATLPATTSSSQNFLNTDVTALVQDMVNFPNQSFGFMLRLVDETYYRSVDFASSDNTNPQLRPKLVVTYNSPTGIKEETKTFVYISPNPFQESVKISFSNPSQEMHSLMLSDVTGKIVREFTGIRNESITLNRGNLPQGIYYFRLIGKNGVKAVSKLVIE